MRRLTAEDYEVDAVTMAKVLVGAWLCRQYYGVSPHSIQRCLLLMRFSHCMTVLTII